jgi:hypothetical protein
MKSLFRLTTLSVAVVLFAGLSRAAAITTYTFTGDCLEDCTGQGMGTLVLQNYTLGQALQTSNFVSFSYTSTILSIEADSLDSDNGSLSGMLPVGLPGPAQVDMQQLVVTPGCQNCNEYDFDSETVANNQWEIGVDDYGDNGTWTAAQSAAQSTGVPEPATIVMLAAGLAGLRAWKLR